MIYLINIASKIIAFVLGLVLISITVAWSKKEDKDYKIINIEEWKRINLLNNELKKRKEVLEKEIIKKVIYNEGLEEPNEYYLQEVI